MTTVREARDAYLAENGFTVEEYDAKWTKASFFGIRFAVLNTRRHRVGIMLHDRYDELLAMSVAELRRMLEVPASGVADRPRKLHAYAPRPAADRQVHQAHAAH